jgi:putative transposase
MIAALAELEASIGGRRTCRALGLSRATQHRRRNPQPPKPRRPREAPEWTLSLAERQAFLDLAHSPRFVDNTATEIFFHLLDDNVYLCSRRTMYRILAEHSEIRERRDLLRHPKYERPELMATGPNQLWSWDITYLRGPARGVYFYLYVVLDVFSRNVVGWMLAHRESEELARELLARAFRIEGILAGTLVLHADRGPAMKAKSVADMLERLGVAKSHSRPSVSDDNPYSESQFKTLKYRPDFPGRFGSFEDALTFCRGFFPWYCNDHYHSGICWLHPADVHSGRHQQILLARHAVLSAAYDAHPDRFPNGRPRLLTLPGTVWINPPLSGAGRPAPGRKPIVHT